MTDFKTLTGLGANILKAKITGKRIPVFLSLFITNKCNLRCKYCFVVREDIDKTILSAEYTFEQVRDIIDEFYSMGTRMVFLLGGEPLLHPEIGRIVDYITSKGIYLHVITNGTLIKSKLNEIKKAHALCVSLDGTGEINDDIRGKGMSAKVIENVKHAVAAGVPVRIHAVLTRYNLNDIHNLAQLCKDIGVTLSISPPNFLGETDMPYMRITSEEYKKFWTEYLDMFDKHFPIGNSREAIVKCIAWPTDYHQFIKPGEKFPGYKPTFCLNGYTYACLGAEGTMYNCINRGCLNGPSIHEHGIKKCWDMLLEWRPDCVSCSSINCIETAMLLDMRLRSVLLGLRFHASRR